MFLSTCLVAALACGPGWAVAARADDGDDCGDLRLDNGGSWSPDTSADYSHPGSMHFVDAQDQRPDEACYAFSAAQMVDAWRFSHGQTAPEELRRHTSAVAAAIETGLDPAIRNDGPPAPRDSLGRRLSYEGGRACDVVEEIRRAGACNDSAVPRMSSSDSDLTGLQSRTAHVLSGLYVSYEALLQKQQRLRDSYDQVEAAFAHDAAACMSSLGFDAKLLPTRALLVAVLDESNPLAFLKEALLRSCTGANRFQPALPRCVRDSGASFGYAPDGYRRLINQRLGGAAPAQPVEVSYCNAILSDSQAALRPGAPCGVHSSLVIGRRRQGGRCQFLVRESVGRGCRNFPAGWECDSGGNVWIDADALARNTIAVSFLDDSAP